MEKYLFHSIMNSKYLGIVTILDYEIRLSTYLSELVLPSCFKGKKALVDLALKSGLDEYRFVEFDVDDNGKCFLYQVNTKHIKLKRLVLHMLNTDYEYTDCVKRGRNPKYETKTIHGYAEAFINLIEAPIVVNGKVI